MKTVTSGKRSAISSFADLPTRSMINLCIVATKVQLALVQDELKRRRARGRSSVALVLLLIIGHLASAAAATTTNFPAIGTNPVYSTPTTLRLGSNTVVTPSGASNIFAALTAIGASFSSLAGLSNATPGYLSLSNFNGGSNAIVSITIENLTNFGAWLSTNAFDGRYLLQGDWQSWLDTNSYATIGFTTGSFQQTTNDISASFQQVTNLFGQLAGTNRWNAPQSMNSLVLTNTYATTYQWVSLWNGGDAVTGSGTAGQYDLTLLIPFSFTSGNAITVNGQSNNVDVVTDSTHLTVTDPWTIDFYGQWVSRMTVTTVTNAPTIAVPDGFAMTVPFLSVTNLSFWNGTQTFAFLGSWDQLTNPPPLAVLTNENVFTATQTIPAIAMPNGTQTHAYLRSFLDLTNAPPVFWNGSNGTTAFGAFLVQENCATSTVYWTGSTGDSYANAAGVYSPAPDIGATIYFTADPTDRYTVTSVEMAPHVRLYVSPNLRRNLFSWEHHCVVTPADTRIGGNLYVSGSITSAVVQTAAIVIGGATQTVAFTMASPITNGANILNVPATSIVSPPWLTSEAAFNGWSNAYHVRVTNSVTNIVTAGGVASWTITNGVAVQTITNAGLSIFAPAASNLIVQGVAYAAGGGSTATNGGVVTLTPSVTNGAPFNASGATNANASTLFASGLVPWQVLPGWTLWTNINIANSAADQFTITWPTNTDAVRIVGTYWTAHTDWNNWTLNGDGGKSYYSQQETFYSATRHAYGTNFATYATLAARIMSPVMLDLSIFNLTRTNLPKYFIQFHRGAGADVPAHEETYITGVYTNIAAVGTNIVLNYATGTGTWYQVYIIPAR